MSEELDPRPLPLIPILRVGDDPPDPDVLATWHEALADAVGVDLPHDLFALWLYPASGGVRLIGPEALAQDDLPVPLPQPRVGEEAIETLCSIVERAGYRSVAALPIHYGRADVGLLLVAALESDRYGPRAREMLVRLVRAIAPTFARIARQSVDEGATPPELGAELAAGWTDARSPRDFFTLASEALERLVSHEMFEVLIPGPTPGNQYRLSGHVGGPPWAEPSLVVRKDQLDLLGLFDDRDTLELPDTATDRRWPAELFSRDLPPGTAVRSVLGVRITSGGHLAGHLLVGGRDPRMYGSEDLAAVVSLGDIIGPKIDTYVLGSQLQTARKRLVTLRNAPAHLSRVADMLATTAQFAEATRRLAEETRAMVPCDRLVLAVRLGDGDRVVLVEPGETKHWTDLPLVPVEGTPLGRVLAGEAADLVTQRAKATELIVPVRVAGRTVGALILATRGLGAVGPDDVAPVQQLADLVAPYVELARRSAMVATPAQPARRRAG